MTMKVIQTTFIDSQTDLRNETKYASQCRCQAHFESCFVSYSNSKRACSRRWRPNRLERYLLRMRAGWILRSRDQVHLGFTEGSGVGLEGEKEFSAESIARIGKADGRYWASETKLEYEFTPNQYVQFELGPLVSAHVIKNVTDLENRNNLAMSGFFGEVRYLVLERNASSPLAVTLSAEPE